MVRSVFYDIADSAEEATNLAARSLLMIAIEERIGEEGWTQARAAEVLGVSQPRVSDLVTGKIDKFSLDALVNMLPAVGLSFRVGRASDAGKAGPAPFASPKSPKKVRPPAPAKMSPGGGARKAAPKKVAAKKVGRRVVGAKKRAAKR